MMSTTGQLLKHFKNGTASLRESDVTRKQKTQYVLGNKNKYEFVLKLLKDY